MKQVEIIPQITECWTLSPVDVVVRTVAALPVLKLLNFAPERAEFLGVMPLVLVDAGDWLVSVRGGGCDGLRRIGLQSF